jgi:hypothetical protein
MLLTRIWRSRLFPRATTYRRPAPCRSDGWRCRLGVTVLEDREVPAAATHLLVTIPPTVTSFTNVSFTVSAVDDTETVDTGYTGTVHLTSTDPRAVLPADFTLVNGTFSDTGLALKTAGVQTLTAADPVSGLTGSAPTTVVPGPTQHFSVVAPPTTAHGVPVNVTVTANDLAGNVTPGYAGTVHITSSDVAAVLPADATLTDGTGTFSVIFNTPGNQTVTATDTVDSAVAGTSDPPTLVTGAATHFSVTATGPVTAGGAFTFTVTALDVNNNTATDYAGTVTFTSSDTGTGVVLPADATLANGTGTFSATLVTAGSQTITAADTVDSAITGTSDPITVDAAAATHFSVTAPATATAGTAFNFTVTALDDFGNTDTNYAGTVHLTSSDTGAGVALPADATLANGTGTFSATLVTAGNQTVTATDTVTASITGTSGPVAVAAAAATHFSVTAPATATAGTPVSVTVTALDQFGNTDTSYAGTVHLTSNDPAAVLPADATLTSGTGNFNVTLKTAGSRTVTATDTATASITGTSGPVAVSAAGAVDHLSVTTSGTATAGNAITVTVTAQDQFGNTVPGYTGTVHFTSTDPNAVLPTNATLTSGTAQFQVTFETAGSQTVTATDTATSSITGTTGPVAVSAAAATHFTVTAPATATAGTPFNFTVTALDQFGNTATGYAGTVHFTTTDTGTQKSLPADATLTNGTGTFPATLVTARNHTITATDTVTASITGTSASIVASPAAATHLTVDAPQTATVGTAITVRVTARDQFENVASGYAGTVHFTSTDGGAVLPADGTLTSGQAQFSVTLNTPGGQTVTATDTATASITGTSGTVTLDPVLTKNLVVGGQPNGTALVFTAGTSGQYGTTPTATLSPFGSIAADVRTAAGDVDGDGVDDTILVTGPGVPIQVAVVSGKDNTVLVHPFDPFGGGFTGGGHVAAGDFDLDGKAEIVVTPDRGGGPRVSIYDFLGSGTTEVTLRANYFTLDPNFTGGIRAAIGNVNRDGTPDLVVIAGAGGGPRVAIIDGTKALTTDGFADADRLMHDFFVFDSTLRNGSYVAIGDVNGDGFGDLMFGTGAGQAPNLLTISGQRLLTAGAVAAVAAPLSNFFVGGDTTTPSGVRVAAKNADGDTKADVVVGSGEGVASQVKVYSGTDFSATSGEPAATQTLDPFAGAVLADGVFVG